MFTSFYKEEIEEINAEITNMFVENGFEDTLDNRYAALTGLRDGWLEDEELENPEGKQHYLHAINAEIFRLVLELTMQRIEHRSR